ncbi:MAG: phosphatase PAP2 family protein [Pseudomonadota bacterium]
MNLLYALQTLDQRLFLTVFRGSESRPVRALARATSRSADGFLLLLIPLCLGLLGSEQAGLLVLLLAGGLIVERPLYWLLKNGLRRRRPQDFVPNFTSLIQAADKFSFPSGHTSAAFMLATAMTVAYPATAVVMFPWAACVAVSRIILGVHYPGDTLAGALMGSSVVLLVSRQLGL